jgi:outer membrane cobalamin receptor
VIVKIFLALALASDSLAAQSPAVRDSLGAQAAPAAHDTVKTDADAAHDFAVAQTAGRDSVALILPEIHVNASRELSEARRRLPTAFVTELNTGTSNHALESISDVLGQAAGVHIEQYGGLGAFSTVSLRGAPPGQVSVYLDGAPLTSAAHGVVNIADLPSSAIERVEVYRAMSPLSMGTPTPGGAINLVTKSSPGVSEARLMHGSFDTWEGSASTGMTRGSVSGLLHAGYQSSDGDFTYLSDNGTPFNPSDDKVRTRVNNKFDAATALGTLRWQARHDLHFMLREDFFNKSQGLPGIGTVPALNASVAFLRSLTQFETLRDGKGFAPEARLSANLERERSRFRDDGGPYGLGELRLGRHDTDDHFASDNGTVELSWLRLPVRSSLTTSVQAGQDRAHLVDPEDGYSDPPPSRRNSLGASVGVDTRPVGEWLTLHAANRWDVLQDDLHSNGVAGIAVHSNVTRHLASPQIGARVVAPLGLELRANWAQASRAPDFLELFGNQGSVTGNPALKPEVSENRDIGASWSHSFGAQRDATIEWAHFESRSTNLILYWANSPNTTRADNVLSAHIRGEELSVRVRPLAPLAFMSSFTWQSAIDTGPVAAWYGKRLPQRPARQAWGRADLMRWGARLSGEIQYIGDNYRDRYNRSLVPSRTLLGASISAPLPGGTRVVLEGKNLSDNHISDVGGYPLPGRSVFASIEWRLGTAGSALP